MRALGWLTGRRAFGDLSVLEKHPAGDAHRAAAAAQALAGELRRHRVVTWYGTGDVTCACAKRCAPLTYDQHLARVVADWLRAHPEQTIHLIGATR